MTFLCLAEDQIKFLCIHMVKVVGYPVSVDKDGSGERRQAERAKRASIQVTQKISAQFYPQKIYAKFVQKICLKFR